MSRQFGRATAWAAITALGLVAGCAHSRQEKKVAEQKTVTQTPPPAPKAAANPNTQLTQAEVDRAMNGWSAEASGAAHQVIDKYGLPDEATPSMLVWYESGDWKRTIVHRDPVLHNFPQPHEDAVEQVIDYRVPAEKLADLDRFDGSLSFNRTRGELTAWGQNEQENIAAINMADDVVQGRMTVEQARLDMARTQELSVSGKTVNSKPKWTRSRRSADPDTSVETRPGGTVNEFESPWSP